MTDPSNPTPRKGGETVPVGPSDAEAIERARAGDHAAFRVLVERYQGRAYRLALRVLRDEEQARDAVQEAFLKAYSSLGRFEGRSSFYTWLYRLVLNLCLDMKRRDRSDRRDRRVEARPLDDGSPSSESAVELAGDEESAGPDLALERLELRRHVARAIDSLPEDARETLVLREVEGLSYQEIADTLRIPKGTVMSRLHYARKRVQRLLIAAGVVEPTAASGEGSRGEREEDGGNA